jgi:plasmid stabilization system protein ParE
MRYPACMGLHTGRIVDGAIRLDRNSLAVYFEIVDGERVQVLALWHGSRGSDPEL